MTFPPSDGVPPTAPCYRHPERRTLVGCGSCERPICTDCMVETPVGMRCPECAHGPRPTMEQRGRQAMRSVRVQARAGRNLTIALIVVNVVAFVMEYMRAGSGRITTALLYDMGAVSASAIANGEWWRVVTGGFLHASTLHILFNMVALWMLGAILEDVLGAVSMGLIYAASVVWGSAGALLANPDAVTVGASGGVFGLMGALLVLSQEKGVHELRSSLLATLGINLVLTFAIPGISIGGHIGGLIGGVVAYLAATRGARLGSARRALSVAAATVVIIGGVAAGLYVAHHPRGASASLTPGNVIEVPRA